MCERCSPDMNASVIRLWWECAGILEPKETVSLARAMGVEFKGTGTVSTGNVQRKTFIASRGGVTLVFLTTGEEVSPD